MKLRKMIDEIYDENELEKNIQAAENLSKEQAQTINNIKAQMAELKKEKLEKQKQEQIKAKQEQLKAQQEKQRMEKLKSVEQNGITTHNINQTT